MFVKEIFLGFDLENKLSIFLFDNKYCYNQMLVECNIKFYLFCEYYFLLIYGKVYVVYMVNGKVIGFLKFNCIVEYYVKWFQVQECLMI